jgi:hypothetical protein
MMSEVIFPPRIASAFTHMMLAIFSTDLATTKIVFWLYFVSVLGSHHLVIIS